MPAAAQKLEPAVGSLVPHDVNEVFLRVSNRGQFGLSGEGAPGNFPRGTPNRYLFGAGLWVGGIGDVDDDGVPDSVTTIGFNPSNLGNFEWIEGAVGFDPDDPRFRVLDTTVPADREIFPGDPVAEQELFAVYADRFSVSRGGRVSIPLGVEVRQRSFAFTEEALETAIFLQWDVQNVSGRLRDFGYTIREMWTGIVLDPDVGGGVADDTAAPLEIDGEPVLLIWDSEFDEPPFDGNPGFTETPGFLAIVPLENPGGSTNFSQMTSALVAGVLRVPQVDPAQFRALAGLPPAEPTFVEPGFDLRALAAWGGIDLVEEAVVRTAAAFVWAAPSTEPPDFLTVDSPELTQSAPFLEDLVAAVRAARETYSTRLAELPALIDFPGAPEPPEPGADLELAQNFPNPFSDATTIEFTLPTAGDVRVEVFDLAGRSVRVLRSGRLNPGVHSAVWDGSAANRAEVPPGVYVVRLDGPGGTRSIRLLKTP